MSSAAKSAHAQAQNRSAAARLRKSVISLSLVNAVEMGIQVFLPMALVRVLTDGDFGLYRTLWLIAITSSGALALGVPGSLYYFLPRLEKPQARVYMVQAAAYMALAGMVAALGTAAFIWRSETGNAIGWGAVPFVGLWVFSSLLDFVFNSQQRVPVQAAINLSFALLRIALVLSAALVYRSWTAILIAQLVVVAVKAVVCMIAVKKFVEPYEPPTRQSIVDHGKYCAPIGISTALYLIRGKIDQWLVASLFSVAQFGAYSIASVFTPIQTLIRITVNQAILPEMNRLQAQENLADMLSLNIRSNLAVGFLMFPSLAFIATWAEPLLTVLFTNRYSDVAPVVRVYLLVLLIESLEVGLILVSMRQGRFMMTVDTIALPIAIGIAALGAVLFGLPGAAAGGVAGAAFAQSALYLRCRKLTGTPLARLQQWRTLGAIIVASGLATLMSLLAQLQGLPQMPILKVALAAALFVCGYWLALKALGLSSEIRKVFGERLAHVGGFR